MPTLLHPIYLPAELLEALAEKTGEFWSSPKNETFVIEAVRSLLKPAPAAPATQPAAQPDNGYQWKQVFLPEGTKLRASFGRQSYFAMVEGEQIKYGKHAISPSCLANLFGSGNRNAWKAVWLRFPGSDEWLLAETCRSARHAAIVRMLGDDQRETPQRSHAASERTGAPNKSAAGRDISRLNDRPLDKGSSDKNDTRRNSHRRRRAAKHAHNNPR